MGRINECIIFSKRLPDCFIIGKHRDRPYDCCISIYRELHGDMEIVYIKDEDTWWMEGMNSEGIAVVNSALLVGFDDQEKKVIKRTGKRSKDGARIKHALKYSNIRDVVDSLTTYMGGVKGHTMVADDKHIYTIEGTSKHDMIITDRSDVVDPIVRTNHGHEYGQAGYSEGEDYLSSVLRKQQMSDTLDKLEGGLTPDEILDLITKSKYSENSPNNVVRNTDKMKTYSQILMIPEKKMLVYKQLKGEFNGVIDNTPEEWEPIIQINTPDTTKK